MSNEGSTSASLKAADRRWTQCTKRTVYSEEIKEELSIKDLLNLKFRDDERLCVQRTVIIHLK